ncbi:HWE histidine kinase domain-containing protein [Qipengyuania spongiae]|uniref:histidine kinase n=1 Tax=Qipengyuania spongiae TaxID=2909673 RepID=A0ABY5T5J6_9SPHN|nr:GntR family transcriptional regulator [Qipengyuania spongiae]
MLEGRFRAGTKLEAMRLADDFGVSMTPVRDSLKRTALQNEILSQELSHRIKNIFAIVSGLISLTARANEAFGEASRDLLGRISALGRAHEFVRPHSEKSQPEGKEVTLATLLATIFETYPAFSERRIAISGPDIAVESRAATPVALVFHELASGPQ